MLSVDTVPVVAASAGQDQGARAGVLGAGMTPLEAARKNLADLMRGADTLHPCGYCGADVLTDPGAPIEHEDGCEVPMMTTIIAALEAAEGLANILTGCLGYLPDDIRATALERLMAYERADEETV